MSSEQIGLLKVIYQMYEIIAGEPFRKSVLWIYKNLSPSPQSLTFRHPFGKEKLLLDNTPYL